MRPRVTELLTVAGVGLFAALGVGYVNYAAHVPGWGSRVMYAVLGLYSAAGAVRLAGRRPEASLRAPLGTSALVVLASVLPLLARHEGETLWSGGAWVAAFGGALGLYSAVALGESFGIAPAVRGIVTTGPYRAIRHPMATAFGLIAGGFLLLNASVWNAVWLGSAAVLAVVAARLEEGLLRSEEAYVEYSARVRWRFVPGIV